MSEVKISDVQAKWAVSRPTIMKAIKTGKLSGDKDKNGRWGFTIDEVVRWRGEPRKDTESDSSSLQVVTPDQTELVEALKKQVDQLTSQVDVKDGQIGKLQEQLRDQTKLLEHQAAQQNRSWASKLFGK
jgi:predicted site-specific integrase-resolvase